MSRRTLLRLLALPAIFLALCLQTFAQERVVTGRITDSNGQGIPGVTVSGKGSNVSTQTNNDGTFKLSLPVSVNTLTLTSVGYTTQDVAVNGSTVNATMAVNTAALSEIVVIGYGTRQKKDLTGAVTVITAKDFNKGAVNSPEQLIAGKVAGVQITTNGGAPGSGSVIRIRGGASLNATNDPLIVIDGIPLDYGGVAGSANALALINPQDIESMNVLKDASATAIYGSRASNGVIIITTKKGKGGAPKFNFTSQYSVSTLPKQADVLSASEFRAYVKSHGTAADIARLGGASTNWQDQVFNNAGGFENNLSMTGSLKNLPYRLSLGYLNQDGMLMTGNFQRKSVSANVSPSFFKSHLKIDLGVKSSFTNTRFADEGAIASAVNFDPTQFVRTPSKQYGSFYEWLDASSTTGLKSLAPRNPVGILEQKYDKSNVDRHILSALVDYKFHFLPDLHLKANLGYDYSQGSGTIRISDSAASVYKRYKDGSGNFHGGVNNQYSQKRINQVFEPYLSYIKEVKSINSSFDVVAGYSYQDFVIKTQNFPDMTTDGTVVSTPTYPSDRYEHNLISYYGRLNYAFNKKYLLTASVRRDGSSRFAPDNRWGWFPAGAFAWRMKDEPFLKNSKLISDLKLRLGYGETGQQEFGFSYLALYTIGNQQAQYQFGSNFYDVYRPDGYNPNLKWESTATSNIGIDYGFLGNRITGSIELYYKKTKDLLATVDQPAGTNFSNKITANVGNMENRGVEFTISATPIRNKQLTWDVSFNATYNKNKITRLTFVNDPSSPGNPVGGIAGGVGNTIQINTVGFPRAAFYVYQQVYDANGKPIENLFEDRDRDGAITSKDLYRYKNPDPTVFLGASSNVSWKKWNAGFVMRANFGNYMYNNRASSTGTMRNLINPLGYLSNGSASVLKTNFTGEGDRYFLSDYFLENASFLRMDNITFGYNAGSFLRKGTNLRIGAAVQNVFLITKYSGVDPEISGGIDNNFYPRPRIFSVNLNLDF